MRILAGGNAIWASTGYGTQLRSLLPRLRAMGHAVANFAWYGLQGGVMNLDGITIYPVGHDVWGNDIVGGYCKHFKADLFLSLMDVWVLVPDFAAHMAPTKWAAWAPVDHDPIPPQVAVRWRNAAYPIAYSRFGLEKAHEDGIPATYIPHGLETAVYRPGDKQAARTALNLPQEAFICSMVAANKGNPARKAFSENIQAFAGFRLRHPEAKLYLHSMQGQQHNGLDLGALCLACGLAQDDVIFVDQLAYHLGLPVEYVANVYRASDVLLAAAMGEGFGLPIMEAQACGCPVITTAWTSMSELTMNGIATVPAQRIFTPLNSWAVIPSVAAIQQALEDIYNWGEAERHDRAQYGIMQMRQHYDWEFLIQNYWAPFLAQVEHDRSQTP